MANLLVQNSVQLFPLQSFKRPIQNISTCHSLKILGKCGHQVMLVVPILFCCNGWQKREKISFAIPPQFLGENGCYFCSLTFGSISSEPYFLSLESSIAPVPHNDMELPVPCTKINQKMVNELLSATVIYPVMNDKWNKKPESYSCYLLQYNVQTLKLVKTKQSQIKVLP